MENKLEQLNIRIDAKSAVPVYEQIKRAIKLAILNNNFSEGDRLASVRELALRLKVNPNTIMKAYYQLEVEGYIYSRSGLGYFVNLDVKNPDRKIAELFNELTTEYISRAVELGYCFEEIIDELERRKRKG